uniref:Eclosion hormone n=1 Tax=Tetranychus urticae TaxID=32264 RepID=T1JWS3_TETUR
MRRLTLILLVIGFIDLTSIAAAKYRNRNQEKVYLCLHNCALCVRFWENGLYNGEKCARKCLKNKKRPKIIDPDCKILRFFKSSSLKHKLAVGLSVSRLVYIWSAVLLASTF